MTPDAAYAYVFDVQQRETGAPVGRGVVVPSRRVARVRASGTVVVPELSDEIWDEIVAWAAAGDAGLPTQPAPMSARVVGALIAGVAPASVIARRVAAMPVSRR